MWVISEKQQQPSYTVDLCISKKPSCFNIPYQAPPPTHTHITALTSSSWARSVNQIIFLHSSDIYLPGLLFLLSRDDHSFLFVVRITSGVIYQVEWAMNNDCGDKSAQSLKYGTTNSKILFGIAESSNPSSCAFKVLGYVAKNRMDDNSWDNFLKTQTTNMPQTTLIRSVNRLIAKFALRRTRNANFSSRPSHL